MLQKQQRQEPRSLSSVASDFMYYTPQVLLRRGGATTLRKTSGTSPDATEATASGATFPLIRSVGLHVRRSLQMALLLAGAL